MGRGNVLIFEKEALSLHLLDVLEIDQKTSVCLMEGEP